MSSPTDSSSITCSTCAVARVRFVRAATTSRRFNAQHRFALTFFISPITLTIIILFLFSTAVFNKLTAALFILSFMVVWSAFSSEHALCHAPSAAQSSASSAHLPTNQIC